MKLEISREQCLRLAELEGDSEVGAGLLARDPTFPEHEWFKVGFGGLVCWNGKVYTAWPWRRWVKVKVR